MTHRLVSSSLLALVCAVVHASATAANEFAAMASALESIQVDDLTGHTDTLADDAFEGREAGTRGGKATSNYLMKELEKYGLTPAGDRGSFFQQFGGYRNVLAVLPGSDEKLKSEYVVLGAHYDHVGYGTKRNSYGSGYIHNGADDNASGTSALLEVAQALTLLPKAPRRSILIAFWDAEEKGLLGSKHWMKHPTIPVENVVFKINADMIGRMEKDKLIVYGTRTGAGLRQIVAAANHRTDLKISYVWWLNPRSDHYTFSKKNIPVLMLHTGLHSDYHRPTDDAHKLNAQGMRRITQLFLTLTYDLAQRRDLPKFRKEGAWESSAQRKVFEAPPAPKQPRLGVTWENDNPKPDAPGLTVKSVLPHSAAEDAGLRRGDRIVQFNGQELTSGDQFRAFVLAAPRESTLQIVRSQGDNAENMPVKLSGNPVQLGISWRENSAEPNAVTVVSVLPGSPTQLAGVRRLDRIIAVDGQKFDGSKGFEELILTDAEEREFDVERDGRFLKLRVTPNKVSTPLE